MKAVLTYHSIDESGSAISVAPRDFRRQMRWLSEHGPRVIPLQSILGHSDGDAVAITVDDGFRNFEDLALPVLREYDLPATLFVVSGRAGMTNLWRASDAPYGIPVLPLLDWKAIARVAGQGIEIGAHSQTHPHLTRLGASELARETHGSRDDIQRELGVAPVSFCYPYGGVNVGVVNAVIEAGYSVAVTTELRSIGDAADNAHLIPRIDMYYFREPGRLESLGEPGFSRYLMLRRAGRSVRSLMSRRFPG